MRPANEWHRLLCRAGLTSSLPREMADQFDCGVDQLIQQLQLHDHMSSDLVKARIEPRRLDRERTAWLPDAVFTVGSSGTILEANAAAATLGVPDPALADANRPVHLPWARWFETIRYPKKLIQWVRTLSNEEVSHCILEGIDGSIWEMRCFVDRQDDRDTVDLDSRWHFIVRDITSLSGHMRPKVERIVLDKLTRLKNRDGLLEQLDKDLQGHNQSGTSSAIFFLDLDGFKLVNDSLGHHTGDRLLQAVSRRIQRVLKPSQELYRLGGDEFVIHSRDIFNLHEVPRLAERVQELFFEPFRIEGKTTYLGVSIGISVLTDRIATSEQWVQQADHAMYQAKEHGGLAHAFYNMDAELEIQQRHQLRDAIRSAIKNRELSLYYQPKCDLKTGEFCGVEALVRWFRDDKMFCSPAEFIREAETCGLILPLSQMIFQMVSEDLQDWVARGIATVPVSVNISATHFQLGDLQKDLLDNFPTQGISPRLIELEITEGSFLGDLGRAVEKIQSLQRLGFTVAIDDFGTGYSSLNYLKNLSADTVKIDRGFVSGVADSEFDQTLVQSVIRAAHIQGLTVVAEGVETREIAEVLKRFDCDEIQGYWYARPMPRTELERKYLEASPTTAVFNR